MKKVEKVSEEEKKKIAKRERMLYALAHRKMTPQEAAAHARTCRVEKSEKKDSRFFLRINKEKLEKFKEVCKANSVKPGNIIIDFIEKYIKNNNK